VALKGPSLRRISYYYDRERGVMENELNAACLVWLPRAPVEPCAVDVAFSDTAPSAESALGCCVCAPPAVNASHVTIASPPAYARPGDTILLHFLIGTDYFACSGVSSLALCAEVAASLAAQLTATATLVDGSLATSARKKSCFGFRTFQWYGRNAAADLGVCSRRRPYYHRRDKCCRRTTRNVQYSYPGQVSKGVHAPMEIKLPGRTSAGRLAAVTDDGVIFTHRDS